MFLLVYFQWLYLLELFFLGMFAYFKWFKGKNKYDDY